MREIRFRGNDFIMTLAEELRMAAYKIETLAAENARLRQFAKDVSDDMECLDTCDSYGHDDLCPVANPVEAWRQLRQEKAELVEALETLRNTCRGLPSKRKTWGDLVDACQKARATLDNMEDKMCKHSNSRLFPMQRLDELFKEADSIIEQHPEFVQEINQEQFEQIEKLVEGVEIDDPIAKLHQRNAELTNALNSAIDRLKDMLMGDDGQAWVETEKALPRLEAIRDKMED